MYKNDNIDSKVVAFQSNAKQAGIERLRVESWERLALEEISLDDSKNLNLNRAIAVILCFHVRVRCRR